MENPDRLKRPIPERTKPHRHVLGALGQSDATLQAPPPGDAGMHGGHPLGPGFDDALPPGLGDGDLIDQGVRAASDLVDAHIRQGEETARLLGRGAAAIPFAQTDVSGLLTGLVRAYSDVASVWVQLIGSLAKNVDGIARPKDMPAPMAAAAPVAAAVGLRIASQSPVEAWVEMFRGAAGLKAQPLVSSDSAPPAQIADVGFDTGTPGAPGMLWVRVPKGQAPGLYHGLLLSAVDQSPVGVLTLRVLAETQEAGAP